MTRQAQANEAKAQAKVFLAIVESFQREGFPIEGRSRLRTFEKRTLATEQSNLGGKVKAIL